MVRIVALTDGTTVEINGASIPTLQAGDHYDTVLAQGSYIESNAGHKILVGQFSQSHGVDGVVNGDPAFTIVPPLDNFLSRYTVAAAALPTTTSEFTQQGYINVTVPTTATASFAWAEMAPHTPITLDRHPQ